MSASEEPEVSAVESKSLRTLLAAVEDALVDVVPGLDVIDRDLDLDGGHCVDLVALEASKRLVFVLLVEGDGRESLASIVDAVVFARRNAAHLGKHWQVEGLRTDLAPLFVAVAEVFRRDALERLSLLGAVDLRLFEVSELRSAAGTDLFLTPRALQVPGAQQPPDLEVDDFLSELPSEQRDLGRTLIRRVSRVDEGVGTHVTPNGVHFSRAGRGLCSLVVVEGRLEGALEDGATSMPIQGEADLDVFLDRVLGHNLRLVDGPAESGTGLDELGSGELLTREELEAFGE